MRKYFVYFCLVTLVMPQVAFAQEATIRDIEFPVDGPWKYISYFGDARSGGRTHEGVDIGADKMTPLVAAVDGYVSFITFEERSWGNAVFLRDADGYTYRYIHMNNDTPGTDDGEGGSLYAFAGTLLRGTQVVKGQLIGWVGDSGNAEETPPHLHFEIIAPGREVIDPLPSLEAATVSGTFDPEAAESRAPTINHNRDLSVASGPLNCSPGSLITTVDSDAVYYCGADGRRYVFPTSQVYFSWYDDFSDVIEIGPAILAQIPLGGNVRYKPGSRMVKIATDPKTYAVDKGGVLRWVTTSEIAESMYGKNWNQYIDDISPTFFINYSVGESITRSLE